MKKDKNKNDTNLLEAANIMCELANIRLIEEQKKSTLLTDKLINACAQGNICSVKSLLSNRVSPNVVRTNGTPAGVAILSKNPLEILNLLANASANPNLQDQNGWFPLFIAAGNNRAEIIRHLIQLGARINEVSPPNGWTALMNSASFGYVESTVELLSLGADTHMRSMDGLTAMDLAAANCRTRVLLIFKKYFELIAARR